MRLRADQQLFLSYLVLVSALTLATSFGVDLLLRRQYLSTIENDLHRELALGRTLYENLPDLPPDSVADILSELSGRRVTIVTVGGSVIGESSPLAPDLPRLEDYRVRPEIRSAIESGEGRAVRFSNTLGTDHLYLAILTGRGELIRFAVPLSEIDQARADVRRGIMAIGMVAVLLSALFSLGFSFAVTRPLRRIGDVARDLAAGDLSRRTQVSSPEELRDLGLALNTLADELQRRLAQLEGERAEMQALIDSMSEAVLAISPQGNLRRANPAAERIFSLGPRQRKASPEVISRKPEFLRLVDRALRGETVHPHELSIGGIAVLATAHPLPDGGAVLVFLDISELRRLEGVRRDFVANASHELKTPLTAIRGYSETLLDPELPPELRSRFAEVVKTNADRLQRIVDDLLDLSRIESGRWRVERSRVPLAPLAEEVWRAQSAGKEEVHMELDLAPGHAEIWADREALRQVLSNLFSNALRYTPTGGSVTVRTRPHAEGGSVVEVQDTGSGIPAVHLGRIFERFYRADPARSREEGGTGLGLAIVKHLIESHGGRVEAESQIGQGTIIRFTLPSRD